jgi:hypothetical protein
MLHSESLILIDQIRKQNYTLNDWESNFLISIETRNPELPLSLKQRDCIIKIYEKSTGGDKFQRKEKFRR